MISCRSPRAVVSGVVKASAANVARCLVETILAMLSDATRLHKLRLKKRKCRDETQKPDAKRQVTTAGAIVMGIGLAECPIRSHNLLEYRD